MHGAVGIAAEAAHLASREGHVGQAPKAVIPEREDGVKSTASTGWHRGIILQSTDQVLKSSPKLFPEEKVLSGCQAVLTFLAS